MNLYYKTLGLQEGAAPQEIKKAYFKAIRKYPPDKAPEQFKKIREAYEYLMVDENRKRYEVVQKIEPSFQNAYNQALAYEKRQDYEAAIACCQEVLHITEVEEFRVLLAKMYAQNEKPGKAIKEYQTLTQQFPENLEYQELLACAYSNRSWTKKAVEIFETLHKKGYQTLDFFFDYAVTLEAQNRNDVGRSILLEALDYLEQQNNTEQPAEKINDIFYALIKIDNEGIQTCLTEDAGRYLAFFDSHEKQQVELMDSLLAIMEIILEYNGSQDVNPLIQLLYKRIEKLQEDVSLNNVLSRQMEIIKSHMEYKRIQRDERILADFKEDIESFYQFHAALAIGRMEDDIEEANGLLESEEYQGSLLDLKLTFLDQWKEAKVQLEIIRQEYPIYAEILGDFVDEVLQGDKKNYLWNKYENKYKRLFHLPAKGHLIRSEVEEVIFDSEMGESYRRETPKIGRNDPCPCGSGKKYKKCCGK